MHCDEISCYYHYCVSVIKSVLLLQPPFLCDLSYQEIRPQWFIVRGSKQGPLLHFPSSPFLFLFRWIVTVIKPAGFHWLSQQIQASWCYALSCLRTLCVCHHRGQREERPLLASDHKKLVNTHFKVEMFLWKGRSFRCDVQLVYVCLIAYWSTGRVSFPSVTSLLSHTLTH